MDRPREASDRPRAERLGGWLKTGVLVVCVLGAVAAVPVAFLWMFVPAVDISSARADSLIVSTADLPARLDTVRFASGGTPMFGVLHLPAGPGPFPAVVVVHGSGPRTAEELAWMGAAWAQAGFAALTYDKRGVGESGGSFTSVGVANSEPVLSVLADDALAAVRFLRRQPDVDAGRVGFVGISQGGWIAPLAARRSDDVAFLVLYSGPAVSVGEEILYSDLTGEGSDGSLTEAELSVRIGAYDGPRGFDPADALARIEAPGLWLLGGSDRSIPVPETVAVLEGLRDRGRPVRWEVYPGADHSLRDGASGEAVDTWPAVMSWLEANGFR